MRVLSNFLGIAASFLFFGSGCVNSAKTSTVPAFSPGSDSPAVLPTPGPTAAVQNPPKPAPSPKPTLAVHSGGMNGGGGRAVVCRKDGDIETAELLDLYEARVLYGLTIRAARGDAAADWKQTTVDLVNHFQDHWPTSPNDSKRIQDSIDPFVTLISLPNRLNNVLDSIEPVVPEKCAIEQAAYFYGDDRLLVQSEIYDHLDTVNRSALKAHEYVYQKTRSKGATDSRSARRFISYFYSTRGLKDRAAEQKRLTENPDAIECSVAQTLDDWVDGVGYPIHLTMIPLADGTTGFAFDNSIWPDGLYAIGNTRSFDQNFYKEIKRQIAGPTPGTPLPMTQVLLNYDTFPSPNAEFDVYFTAGNENANDVGVFLRRETVDGVETHALSGSCGLPGTVW